MSNEIVSPVRKRIEDMNLEESILDQASIALKCAAYKRSPILPYEDFRQALLEDRGLDVTKAAVDANFPTGPAYLRHLGLAVDENGNLIVPTFEEAAVSSKFIAAKRVEEQKRAEKRQYYKENQNVQYEMPQIEIPIPFVNQTFNNDVLEFNGDINTLHPGMRVRIANGQTFILPSIEAIGLNPEQTQRLRKKCAQKYRKKVKEIVKLDAKTRETFDRRF